MTRTTLYHNIKCLAAGLRSVILDSKVYLKDSYLSEEYGVTEDTPRSEVNDILESYLRTEAHCFFIKRKNLFYRTDEEANDVFSEAFIEAFFRGGNYPIKSYKGYTMNKGVTRDVRLSKFLKDSLMSKVITINTAIHDKKTEEIAEHKIYSDESEGFGFDEFISANGVESLEVTLEDSVDLDECDQMLKELSDIIYPQVSYVMLLKDYEISQDEFKEVLKYNLNVSDVSEDLMSKYEDLIKVIGNVILNNKEKLGRFFCPTRLDFVEGYSY